jgi:transcriptional regulator with XRE-family HTH domain
MQDDLEHIAKRFVDLRQKENLSQKEFAAKIGVGQSLISDIEGRHRLPSKRIVDAVNRVFDLEPNWLISGTEKDWSSVDELRKQKSEIQEKERQIAVLHTTIAEKDRQIADLRALIEGKNQDYNRLDAELHGVKDELLGLQRELLRQYLPGPPKLPAKTPPGSGEYPETQ